MKSFAEGILKAFVSGDHMFFDPKHRPAFTAKATAEVLIGTNQLPPINDKSNGVWRRASVLPFPVTIEAQQRNPHLDRQLYGELSGIFRWAVGGLLKLRERGHFEEPQSSRSALERYRNDSSPVRMFLSDTCVKEEGGLTDRRELYRDYKR